MSSAEEVKVTTAESQPEPKRRVNPVYKALRDKVHQMADQLRSEYDAGGDLRENLMKGNHGVRCFMRWQDIVGTGGPPQGGSDLGVESLIQKFRRPDVTTELQVTTDSAINQATLDDDTSDVMVALYAPNTARAGDAPQADPLGLIYGGLPSELTDLALRSDLLWHLKAPALYLAESNQMCKLHATTSFYLPTVEVRKDSFDNNFAISHDPTKLSLMLTADVQCVIDFWSAEARDTINTSNLIRTKLLMPLHMALRQNVNRQKLGLPLIRNVVIGDMNIPYWEHGINTLFAQRVKEMLATFDGCFDTVTICGPLSTVMHLNTFVNAPSEA